MCVCLCLVYGVVVCHNALKSEGATESPMCRYSATPVSRWRWRVRWPRSSRCPPSRPCPSSPCTGRWKSHPRWTAHHRLRRSPPGCRRFPSRCPPAMSGCPAEACCLHRCFQETCSRFRSCQGQMTHFSVGKKEGRDVRKQGRRQETRSGEKDRGRRTEELQMIHACKSLHAHKHTPSYTHTQNWRDLRD